MKKNTDNNYSELIEKTLVEIDKVTIFALWGLYDLLDEPCKPPNRRRSHNPLGAHWCIFQPHVLMRNVGEDGHPKGGKFMPDPPNLPRRMFAGSK